MSLGQQPLNDGTFQNIPINPVSPTPPLDYSKMDQETLFKIFGSQITITAEEIERRLKEPRFTYEEVKAEIKRQLEERFPGEV